MDNDDFNLFGYSDEEIEQSGFGIVADIWSEDNPNATEKKLNATISGVSFVFLIWSGTSFIISNISVLSSKIEGLITQVFPTCSAGIFPLLIRLLTY